MILPALALCTLLSAAEKPKMMVLELQPTQASEAHAASDLTDAIAAEVAARGVFDVIATKDVQTMIGVERQRQLLGCSEEGRCLTELAGAIGARFVLSGQLGKLGSAYQLSLEGLDTFKAKPLGRSSRIAKDEETLRMLIPYAVAEATGMPAPEPPSKAMPYTLLGLGGAGLLAGAYFGFDGLSRDGQISEAIKQGQLGNAPLASTRYYQQLSSDAARQKTIGLIALGAGAVAVAAGTVLLWRTPSVSVAAVPTTSGVAFAGTLP